MTQLPLPTKIDQPCIFSDLSSKAQGSRLSVFGSPFLSQKLDFELHIVQADMAAADSKV